MMCPNGSRRYKVISCHLRSCCSSRLDRSQLPGAQGTPVRFWFLTHLARARIRAGHSRRRFPHRQGENLLAAVSNDLHFHRLSGLPRKSSLAIPPASSGKAAWASGLAFHFHYQAVLNPRHMTHRFGPKPAKSPFLVGRLPRTPFRPATAPIQSLHIMVYPK